MEKHEGYKTWCKRNAAEEVHWSLTLCFDERNAMHTKQFSNLFCMLKTISLKETWQQISISH